MSEKKEKSLWAYKAGDVSHVAFNPWKVNKVLNNYLFTGFNYCRYIGFKF